MGNWEHIGDIPVRVQEEIAGAFQRLRYSTASSMKHRSDWDIFGVLAAIFGTTSNAVYHIAKEVPPLDVQKVRFIESRMERPVKPDPRDYKRTPWNR